jgi:hypothetical protein
VFSSDASPKQQRFDMLLLLDAYWEVFELNNKKRSILWFQVFKKKKPNCS